MLEKVVQAVAGNLQEQERIDLSQGFIAGRLFQQ